MDELWAQIKEFPNYSISTNGSIRNESRTRLVKTSVTERGVVKVGLVRGGQQSTRSVKVLVAEAFVPGKTEKFDTPIHKDGNQENNNVNNIVWRPRWFAWKYHRQFDRAHNYSKVGPLKDRGSGIVYTNLVEAAIAHGLLFNEIHMSLVNKVPVFPTWQQFERV